MQSSGICSSPVQQLRRYREQRGVVQGRHHCTLLWLNNYSSSSALTLPVSTRSERHRCAKCRRNALCREKVEYCFHVSRLPGRTRHGATLPMPRTKSITLSETTPAGNCDHSVGSGSLRFEASASSFHAWALLGVPRRVLNSVERCRVGWARSSFSGRPRQCHRCSDHCSPGGV